MHEQQLLAYAQHCVQPAYAYFQSKFDLTTGELKHTLEAFKTARFYDPTQLNEIKQILTDIDFLTAFDFIDSEFILKLKGELPMYLAAVEDIAPAVNINDWWKGHAGELPAWTAAYGLLLLIQPSSTTAERVFSVLQSSFSTKQNSSLEVYICTSVMLSGLSKQFLQKITSF